MHGGSCSSSPAPPPLETPNPTTARKAAENPRPRLQTKIWLKLNSFVSHKRINHELTTASLKRTQSRPYCSTALFGCFHKTALSKATHWARFCLATRYKRYYCNKFFRLLMHAVVTKCDGAQTANFWRNFASCISSEPRAAHFGPEF